MKLFLLLLPFALIFSAEDLVVELSTHSNLKPLYVEKILKKTTPLTSEYLETLHDIFVSDFAIGGRARVSSNREGAQLKTEVIGNKLSATLYDRPGHVRKNYKNIHLTGSINQDRRTIHMLSDTIHSLLFGEKSIASLRLFFAKRMPGPDGYTSEIWECDSDGTNMRQITNEGNYAITPTYLPSDGSSPEQLLYVSYKLGPPKIFSTPLTHFAPKQAISLRGNQLLPTFSKTAKMIAFISDASGRADLFLQIFEQGRGSVGKPRQLYSVSGSVQASSCFSPDGSKIAFVSDKEGTPKIYLIDLTTLKSGHRPSATCITKKFRENTGPSFSPDGKKIAYSAKIDGVRQICVYDRHTKEEKVLTKGAKHKENPCFAPNSLHIIYNTTGERSGGGTAELFLLNLNNPTPVQITGGPGKKHYPTWGA
ncbi:MAG: hypothetical protein SNF33_03470 [Candidatus Algichlamydia australiensis]|nr:hypothetical protein [Chlamydiales bacterium]